jgi:hypothetical protein
MTTPNTLFRKKPVEVEAFQLPAAGVDVPDAFHEWCERVGFSNFESGRDETLLITTPEGVMEAQPGDWIICGVMGEFYPCKPEVFAATYAPATLPSIEADDEPGYVETVIACLGDDAAALRSENSESEVAENMERAADLLAALASPMAVQVAEALTFYAEGNHFIQHEPTAWDTVSGEPQNFFEDEANTATVEDGSIAKIALASLAEATAARPTPLAAAADRLDAERYRWLRVQHWYAAKLCVVTDPKRNVRLGTDCPSDARLDELIDAERGAAPVQREAAGDGAAPLSDRLPKGFLSDVLTAAGLVTYGRQCKALGDRLGRAVAEIKDVSIEARRAALQPAQGAPATCRMNDGRCGICGGDWSVCGCDGMLRRAALKNTPSAGGTEP